MARKADTIAYEITCSVGKRVRRTYRGGADVLVPAQPSNPRPARCVSIRARHELERPSRSDAGADEVSDASDLRLAARVLFGAVLVLGWLSLFLAVALFAAEKTGFSLHVVRDAAPRALDRWATI